MSYNAAALATALGNISAVTELAARQAWADAWATYFAAAVTSNGVSFTANTTAINNAKSDMVAAMVGLSTVGQDAIEGGIVAWWLRLSGAPGTYFTGASSIAAPAGLTSIASAMEADVFVANRLETTKAPAMTRLANFLHGKNAGGTATIGGTPRTIS